MALQGLARRFGERPALDGVSVAVYPGQTLGVFGPNGAGKSTLLRVLATLLRPHGGTVQVAGAPLPAEAWRVRGRIGYLGHDPLLYRELTPRENLRFHARLHGASDARVDLLLEGVGLGRRADDPVRELSRGMVQRAAAARAVLHDPPLLLLDEPRVGLDPAGAALLEPLLGRPSGRTRVLVTHDLRGGLAECDLALGLRGGHQALLAPAAEVEPSRLGELYS
ncbi:MAG TPA: ABC transporter ATP-binding protein [Thermoleophilaceae bacterium]|nr:ABC transporter ATP-binding protein [Thermoleophilaceae bacterium]